MTSQISNAPNIGFTQGGGFTAVTMRNGAGWYGLAGGAVSSATPGSAPNTVSTVNGTPVAGFSLNNATTNLLTGAVSNSQSKSGSSNYTFNPITAATPTFSASNHPTLALSGYLGGVMLTANGGSPGAPTNFTKPYVVTNPTGTAGGVTIFLPGDSSEMLAVFNVQSQAAPTGGMKNSSYVFGSLDADSRTGLNGARGAYVNPSNFAARAAAIYDNGANLPISSRDGVPLFEAGGFANQQMVTAETVGANTASFLSSISTVPVTVANPNPVKPCACESTQWGFWSAFNGATNSNGQLAFEDQGSLLLWVAGVPTSPGNLPATGSATYTGHAIANIANPNNITSYLAAGSFANTVNFGTRSGAVTINGLDGTNYAGTVNWVPSTTSFATISPLTGNNGGRTATLAGSFFQGGATNTTPLYGEMGGSLVLNGAGGYLGSGIFAARKP
jgi:hypothetical protein